MRELSRPGSQGSCGRLIQQTVTHLGQLDKHGRVEAFQGDEARLTRFLAAAGGDDFSAAKKRGRDGDARSVCEPPLLTVVPLAIPMRLTISGPPLSVTPRPPPSKRLMAPPHLSRKWRCMRRPWWRVNRGPSRLPMCARALRWNSCATRSRRTNSRLGRRWPWAPSRAASSNTAKRR
jgi:hypothetical protein